MDAGIPDDDVALLNGGSADEISARRSGVLPFCSDYSLYEAYVGCCGAHRQCSNALPPQPLQYALGRAD